MVNPIKWKQCQQLDQTQAIMQKMLSVKKEMKKELTHFQNKDF